MLVKVIYSKMDARNLDLSWMLSHRRAPVSFHQARLDQCKVTMGTLEKQLEEEKQRVQAAESQRGAGTGIHQTHKKHSKSVRGIVHSSAASSAVARGYAAQELEWLSWQHTVLDLQSKCFPFGSDLFCS